ncbi:MAG: RNA polymerase sigma factor [Anaerolineae bacterium]
MVERTNQEWLAELRGLEQEEALADLRALLVKGLRYAMADRPAVTEADLEDFAQEALLKTLAGLDTFRGESRFTTWAQKIAVRVAFTELRRRRWKDVSIEDLIAKDREGDWTPSILADAAPSPEQRVTQQLLMEMVQRLIAEELTERQRQAMTAAVIGGMPLEEVARRMGTNRNALYKLLHDARRRLQTRMMAIGLSPQDVLAAFES